MVDCDLSHSPDLSDDLFEPQRQQHVSGDQNQVIGQLTDGNVISNVPNDVSILPQKSQPETPIWVDDWAVPEEEYEMTDYTLKEIRERLRQELQQIRRKEAPSRTRFYWEIIVPVAIATCASTIFSYWLKTVLMPAPVPEVLSEAINVRYSPSGRNILTTGERTARLWDIQGKLSSVIGRKGDTLNAVFSPDSKLIATTEIDGNIKLWDYQGRRKVTLNGNKSLITGVVFSPDGKFIAAASSDKNISLWNSQGILLSVRKDKATVINLIFSPDGKYILTANKNGIVHRWDLFSQNPNLSF